VVLTPEDIMTDHQTTTTDKAAEEIRRFTTCWEALQHLNPQWTEHDKHGHARRMVTDLAR
jgi:hypothetical protein